MVSPAELERLTILSEEMAEAQQEVAKILRFGWDSHHPAEPMVTNRDRLEVELGHVLNAMNMLHRNKHVDYEKVRRSLKDKELTISDFLSHP